MKKYVFALAFFASSYCFGGFTTSNLTATSTFTVTESTIVIHGTTYYWQAGTGSSGQFLKTDGATTPTLTFGTASGGGGGGSSSLAIATGSVSGFSGFISSPTAIINFSSDTFNGQLTAGATAFITLNIGSVTLQGQNVLTFSSATATYLQLSSAAATYLQLSSAAATYFYLTSSTTLLNNSSATVTYLQLSSAAVTYPALSGGLVPNVLIDGSSITKAGVLVAGSNITLTPGSGTMTIASSGSGGGTSIYPATATASFPFGFSASSANFTSTNSYVYVSSFNVGGASITYEAAGNQVQITTHVFVYGNFVSSGNASGFSTIDRGLIINNGNYTASGSSANFTVKGNSGINLFDVDPNTQITTVISSTMSFTNNFVSTNTANIGWGIKSQANQACNTTCTYACVFGEDTAVVGTLVACTDATADVCLCAGPN